MLSEADLHDAVQVVTSSNPIDESRWAKRCGLDIPEEADEIQQSTLGQIRTENDRHAIPISLETTSMFVNMPKGGVEMFVNFRRLA